MPPPVAGPGENRAGEAAAESLFPTELTYLGRRDNSMGKRNTELGRWVKGFKRKHRKELLAGQSHRFQEGLDVQDEEVC